MGKLAALKSQQSSAEMLDEADELSRCAALACTQLGECPVMKTLASDSDELQKRWHIQVRTSALIDAARAFCEGNDMDAFIDKWNSTSDVEGEEVWTLLQGVAKLKMGMLEEYVALSTENMEAVSQEANKEKMKLHMICVEIAEAACKASVLLLLARDMRIRAAAWEKKGGKGKLHGFACVHIQR